MGINENRRYYLGRGRCPDCNGANFVEPGRCRCTKCRERRSELDSERRERRREAGLCTRCGKPVDVEGYVWCSKCRAKSAKSSRKSRKSAHSAYYQARNSGRCYLCGKLAIPGKGLCEEHYAEKKEYQRKYREKNHDVIRQKRLDKIAAGLCIDCGQPVGDEHTRCPRCRELRMDSNRKYRITKRIEREAEEARKRNVQKYQSSERA